MVVENWLLRADPNRRAVDALTYEHLILRARHADVPAGARVGIAFSAGARFAIALHACWMRGSIAVPLDPRLPEGDWPEVDHVLRDELEYVDPVEVPPLDLDRDAVLMRTSGTTGGPRTVALTFGNLLWSALGSAAMLGARADDRWICALPVAHVGGLSVFVRSAIAGSSVISHERWVTENVAAETPTLISLVPTMLARLLDAGWRAGPWLRWALVGGAPLSPALRERARQAGVPIAATYGLTEACSQVTTFGVPLFCTRVRLASDGEIVVSGPTVAGGGPLATGDLGRRLPDGTLAVVGRKTEMIITGGENVAPTDVEAVLEQHDDVIEALVGGRPDDEWGEAVTATVVARPGSAPQADELRAFCAARLAPFQVPKEIAFADELPRTASGKLIRGAPGMVGR